MSFTHHAIHHVILSAAKDLRARPIRVPTPEILRGAQDDMPG
jgi:hypothetical protein